jgi:hypothetical protein
MLRRIPTTWFLVSYFALLVNLGPSMHHADIFGLHVHMPGSSEVDHCVVVGSVSGAEVVGENSCCCRHHAGTLSAGVQAAGKSQTDLTQSDGLCLNVDDRCHGCLLCDFFKHFNASESSFDFQPVVASVRFKTSFYRSFVAHEPLASDARGPPAII